MEAQSGSCKKNNGGPHNWKFGKCSHCGMGEGGAVQEKFGECPKGGKHIYKFSKCTKCGALEGNVSAAGPPGNAAPRSKCQGKGPKTISTNEMKIYEEDFNRFDLDRSGALEEKEIVALIGSQLGRAPNAAEQKKFLDMADKDGDGKISLQEYIKVVLGGSSFTVEKANRKSCPSCAHSWLDKYGKDECPKCLAPLSGGKDRRQSGEASTNKQSAGSAMEAQSGSCKKNNGGPHNWKFGKCSHCGMGEGGAVQEKFGECPKGGKHIYKFSKCTKCGAAEF